MKDSAKSKLHSFLNAIFYIIVTVNFIVPLSLLALSTFALSYIDNVHWSVEWTVKVSLALAIVEAIAQIIRTVKLFKNKK